MYYIINNETIEKYVVTLDKEKLAKLKQEIIEKCGEITNLKQKHVRAF